MKAHRFEPGFTGMVCGAMVMRDGGGDACGLPASQHDQGGLVPGDAMEALA